MLARAIITPFSQTQTSKDSMTAKRRILVTSALPYANGSIHMGHMLEYIQTDIWVRFQRAMGHEVVFAWASDAHGTPVMLRAEKDNINIGRASWREGGRKREVE